MEEGKKQPRNIQIRDIDGFLRQATILESIIKKDAPHLLKEFKKLNSYYCYPDFENYINTFNIINTRTKKVMDAIKKVGKDKRAIMPDFKRKANPDIWSDSLPVKNYSLENMVFTAIKKLHKYQYSKDQKKKLTNKINEFLLEYLSQLTKKERQPYKKYRRSVIVGRIAYACGYIISDEVEIDSPNKVMENAISHMLPN